MYACVCVKGSIISEYIAVVKFLFLIEIGRVCNWTKCDRPSMQLAADSLVHTQFGTALNFQGVSALSS